MREGKRVKDKESGERRRVWLARGKVCVREGEESKTVEESGENEGERESSEKRGELEREGKCGKARRRRESVCGRESVGRRDSVG